MLTRSIGHKVIGLQALTLGLYPTQEDQSQEGINFFHVAKLYPSFFIRKFHIRLYICIPFGSYLILNSGCGVIGSRARLRIWCREAWGFESLHPDKICNINTE